MTSILRRGSRGAAVRELQTQLNAAGVSPRLVVDGDFGPATDRAVRAFQTSAGLVVDGLAGSQTRTALRQAITPAQAARTEPDKSAMAQPAPATEAFGRAEPPPNVASLRLLDTARSLDTIWIHCAATPDGRDFTVADIRSWHKQRGWADIGYHYVVYRDGRIMLGRPIGQVGAHVSGHNARSAGVVYIGGVSSDGRTAKDTRTGPQRSSLLWLAEQLIVKHSGIRRVRGHNEVAAKACPSFDVRKDPLGALI